MADIVPAVTETGAEQRTGLTIQTGLRIELDWTAVGEAEPWTARA